MNGRDLGLLFGGFAVGLVTWLMFKKKEEPTKEEPDVVFEDKVSDASVELSQHYANMAQNTHMVSSLIHEIEEKMKKETEDGNKPYFKENPPSPMTEEQLRVYDDLKKKSLFGPLLKEEALAL